MSALELVLSEQTPPRDNTDPHPVTLRVEPRDVVAGRSGCTPTWWEADYSVEVAHPDTCSGLVEECPLADYLETLGHEADLYAPWPEQDFLTDAELERLDGQIRYAVVTRHLFHNSGPYGDDWSVEYEFSWTLESDPAQA